ncbi:MAG: PilZ domain-containing protein [Dorea sp.]|jgi:c-di-GMP-binding flagellar brake protein YcgR|nr:PilZ domain-containing protein [Dorea sp.]
MFLTECKQAVLYTVEDIFLCDAAVSHISEDSATLIVTKSNADLSLTEAHVTFFDSSKGLVTYSCELSEFKKSKRATNTEYYFTRCTVHEQISVMQRRNDIKVPVNISVTLSAKTREGTLSNIEAKIWNISAGGIFFTSRQSFSPGDIASFHFSNPDLPSLTLQVEILRLQAHRELRKIIGSEAKDTELTGYGCQFVHLPSRAESQIRNYVFRQDLIHRRWVSSLD